MIKTSSYHDALVESLGDPVEARNYLMAVLEDYPAGFLKALRNVAQAHQMKKVAEAAGVKRESLYRALSEQGNPTWDTLNGILGALGFKFSITPIGEEEPVTQPAASPTLELKASSEAKESIVNLNFFYFHAQTIAIAAPSRKQQIGMMEFPIRPQPALPPLIGERNANIIQ